MKSKFLLLVIILSSVLIQAQNQQDVDLANLQRKVQKSLEKGVAYMQTIAIEGGYVYHYTLDGKEKWGEGKTDDRTVEVQPPGTPAVGMSFLKAYRATNNKAFLKAAEDAAGALIKGQNELGGWEHKIYFDRPKGKSVSFDDNQTQSAISFIMALDQEIDSPELSRAVEKALEMMQKAQLENGGWPHKYPWQGNYHDFATFNDQGVNDCIRVMIEADSFYDNPEIRKSLLMVGRFMMISQLPPPQPGWAQQYNEYLQPAWARSFEPPAVCPSASIHNINSLIDLFEYTGNRTYLEPIPDALKWLKESQLPNGKWGRFLEIGTNKPLYYDRGRIRVESTDDLSLERRTGYGYETDLKNALNATENRYLRAIGKKEAPVVDKDKKLEDLVEQVQEILKSQDETGRWVVKNDKFRKGTPGYQWQGEYRFEDRISSALFNKNVVILCEFLQTFSQVDNSVENQREIKIEKDLPFGKTVNFRGENETLLLDIYSPVEKSVKKRPAIMWMHGGGFRLQNDKSQRYIVSMSERFARRGYVCLSINYRVRQNPKNDKAGTLLDAMEDAMTGLEWLRENADKLGVDKSKIIIGGGSAGGILGNHFCYNSVKNREKLGVVTFVNLWGSPDESWGTLKIDKNDPPTIIVHGKEDTTVPFKNSEIVIERLKKAGVKNHLVAIEGAGHTPADHMDNFEKEIALFLKENLK